MKRAVWLLALAACPADEATPLAPLPPESVARLVSKEGTVTLTRSGQRGPAQVGALLENDELETQAASRALVRAPGGREIELGEKTHFKVGKNLGDIEVSEGSISFLAADEGDGGVTQVTTRFGRTAVAPGTRATLLLGPSGLAVDVSVGVITQVEEDGGTRTANAGEKLEFGVGSIEVVDEGAAPQAAAAVQLTAEGRVLLKKKGEAKFAAAKKGAQELDEGSSFQVGPAGHARLSFDGASVKLPAGTNGALDGAVKGKDGDEVALNVSAPVAVALDGKAPVKLTLTGKTPLEVKGRTEAFANVTRNRVEVVAGELELTANGKAQTVKAGEVASVTPTGVEVAPRARPAITVPMGKKVRVYAKRGLSEVGLQLPDELARAQVANDAAFTDVVLSGSSKELVVVQPPASGELYWRTVDDKGESAASGRVRFLPDVGSAKDEASRGDQVNETGLKATVFFQGAVPTLTFNFNPVDGARGYRLRVYRANDLSTPVVDKKTTEAKATVDPGMLTEGSYRWSASALDEAGNDKVGGRMNQMDIIYDNSLTTLQLSAPKDGDRADSARAQGTAPLGSKLFLNGKTVPTDASGRFSVPAPKVETLVFRVVGSDGSESYWLRRLKK
jgi:hypothetical protein